MEILVFLRNSDILSTTQRGVTTTSDTITATAGQTTFNTTNYTVRNIRSVTVNGAAQTPYLDYTPTYNTGAVSSIVLTTPATLNDSVKITYDYSSGTNEKIWPDYPQKIYLSNDCPRIGFDIKATRTDPIGIGSVNYLTDLMVRVKIYDIGSYKNIETYMSTLRSAVKAADKSFYHFRYVYIGSVGPVIDHPKLSAKVFERSADIIMRFSFET